MFLGIIICVHIHIYIYTSSVNMNPYIYKCCHVNTIYLHIYMASICTYMLIFVATWCATSSMHAGLAGDQFIAMQNSFLGNDFIFLFKKPGGWVMCHGLIKMIDLDHEV